MQEENWQLNRRSFIKFSGAAAVGMAGSEAFARSSDTDNPAPLGTRSAPSNPLVLRSPDLELVLDRGDGLPYEYRILQGNRRMRGEDLGRPLTITFYNKSSKKFTSAPGAVRTSSGSSTSADFLFDVKDRSQSAVSFGLRYIVEVLRFTSRFSKFANSRVTS